MNPIDFIGQRSRSQWTYIVYGNKPVNMIETKPLCISLSKLGRHVNDDERMKPIDFGGQRSKVKVTMDIYGNKLVNTIETKPLCISLSNLADMFTMVRGWTLLILEVKAQGHNGHIWK